MKQFIELTNAELEDFYISAKERYDSFAAQNLQIDMSRGKPCREQLDISEGMLTALEDGNNCKSSIGNDCRSYGSLSGVLDCKQLFGDLLGVPVDNIIACGNSSLNLMYDYVSQCYTHGVGADRKNPWMNTPGVKMIAVVPGYDRHFAIAEHFGIELVSVKMMPDGPDMRAVEALVEDPSVKGMFCVPKYSNPDGVTYSDDVVERLAGMKTAAEDFRVIWDDAYCVHNLYEDDFDTLANVFDVAKKYGNEDRFIEFVSTSKISFPGSGVAAIAASDKNVAAILDRLFYQTISYDKMNQLRHARVFKNVGGILEHMKLHAEILRPKFEAVLEIFDRELSGLNVAHWSHPKGGYFISLEVTGTSARRVGELCKQAGLKLTNVGATFPYGMDPDDSNIRIAPSYPPIDELKISAELLCVAIKLACCE